MADPGKGLGPVQLLVIGFEHGRFEERILEELRRLREHDIVRMIDLLFVAKDEDGELVELERNDLTPEEAAEFGALVGALLGTAEENRSPVDPEQVWYLADAIPPGTSAAIALVEHRWAIPLRNAIRESGDHDLLDAWVHPDDLLAAGACGTAD